MYIIGKTGMGKTTLLENMAVQDIQNGEGIAFVDPHGDTAERLLDFVPKERINDVIYFNPSDISSPVAFNVMENVDPERRHLVADGLMGVFKKIWTDVWSARMEYILNNAILALLEYPDATILGINQMLINKDFRKKVVEHITDPVVKAFWTQEFAKYTDKYAAEATPAIQNKIGQFVSNPLIRNIVGQSKSAFDIRRAMDEKKIIIVNLSKGLVGEDNSRLIGAMLITKLYLAAMSRVDILEPERKDFFLYVDEFQNFASESFASILSEARKYRLSLILTHQYVAQMKEEVRDAVFGNVGTTVTFRVGAEDAELLEKEFSPEFMVEDIVNLGFANIYLRLMIDGVASHPFSAKTLPPIQQLEHSFKNEIIEASRKNYGTSRAAVEEAVQKMMEDFGSDAQARLPDGQAPRERRPERSFVAAGVAAKPAVPLYDAVCTVCGKKTQVPFPPDPARPVFCKEHIGMAGRFKQAFTRPSAGEFVPRQETSQTHQPFKRTENIQMLREALKKSLDAQKTQSQPQPAPKNDSGSGTLKPGERIEL